MKSSKKFAIFIIKILNYLLSGFFILAGILSLTKYPALCIVSIVLGIVIFKSFNKAIKNYSLNENNKKSDTEEVQKNIASKTSKLNTYITGVTHKNDEGKDIQKLFKNYVSLNYDSTNFEDYTNDEIIENDLKINEYTLVEINTIYLLPEPNNLYDSNAIKVIHKDIGHIGYIPRDYCVDVKNFIDTDKKIEFIISFRGGKTKLVENDENLEDIVVIKDNNYYVDLTIKKWI